MSSSKPIRNSDKFLPNRLRVARLMAGWSLDGFVERLGNVVSKSALWQYETGRRKPDANLIMAFAAVLNVTVEFFFHDPPQKVALKGVCYKRGWTKMSNLEKLAVEERAKEAFGRYFELEFRMGHSEPTSYFQFDYIIYTPQDSEMAAEALRKIWNLGYNPIPDVVDVLEDKGFKVMEINAPLVFESMSAHFRGYQLIALRKIFPGEGVVNQRISALMELACLSLRFPEGVSSITKMKLCQAFAFALLYPREMVAKDFPPGRKHMFLEEIILIKERWGIPFFGIFERAFRLGHIPELTYKKFCQTYKLKGLDSAGSEPGRFLSTEKPLKYEKLILLALGNGLITPDEAAYFTGLTIIRLGGHFRPFLKKEKINLILICRGAKGGSNR